MAYYVTNMTIKARFASRCRRVARRLPDLATHHGDERDALKIDHCAGMRVVDLFMFSEDRSGPEIDRWRSFGWYVLDHDEVIAISMASAKGKRDVLEAALRKRGALTDIGARVASAEVE